MACGLSHLGEPPLSALVGDLGPLRLCVATMQIDVRWVGTSLRPLPSSLSGDVALSFRHSYKVVANNLRHFCLSGSSHILLCLSAAACFRFAWHLTIYWSVQADLSIIAYQRRVTLLRHVHPGGGTLFGLPLSILPSRRRPMLRTITTRPYRAGENSLGWLRL
jgi:hypothetical protein